MAQVKFYSVSEKPSQPLDGGVYFVTGGELYKGANRFGANKVWSVPSETNQNAEGFNLESAKTAAGVTGAISGDILTGYGAAKVFNGTTWVDLGQDEAALTDQLKSLVSGLAFASGTGSYITGITQDGTTGEVTAQTSDFATDVKTAIGTSTSTSTANGIQVQVTTTSGSVTGVTVSAGTVEFDTVSANTGNFQSLNVSGTASFAATTVSATTLTIGGSTVEQLADKQIAAIAESYAAGASNGITVSVTTSGGNVTGVKVDATAFANAIHFGGVVTALDSTGLDSEAGAGNIYVVGANPTGFIANGLPAESDTVGAKAIVAGQEYIWTGSEFELIGDQNTYALNAYTSDADVYDGVETVPAALNAIGAAVDTLNSASGTRASVGSSYATYGGLSAAIELFSGSEPTITLDGTNVVTAAAEVSAAGKASNLVTAGAVSSYVGTVIDGLAGSSSAASKGVEVEVISENGEVKTVNVSVTAESEMGFGATGSADELATTAAVKDFFDNNLVWLNENGTAITT